MDDFNVPVDEHKDMMQDEENAFMGYARCSLNIRKAQKKIYGPGDLKSKEVQTDVTLPCMFHFPARAPSHQWILVESRETQTDVTLPCMVHFQTRAPSPHFIVNKEKDKRMRAVYRQLKRG